MYVILTMFLVEIYIYTYIIYNLYYFGVVLSKPTVKSGQPWKQICVPKQ